MRLSHLAQRAVPVVIAAVFLLPLAFMLLGSLRAAGQPPPLGIDLIPDAPTLESFSRVGRTLPLAVMTRNSLLVAGVAVPVTVFIGALAGFAIRMAPPRRKRWLIVLTVVAMLVPVTAVWATRFQIFKVTGLIDSLIPVGATALIATNPFLVLIYAWSFHGIDQEQLEAASLDGASTWQLWWRIGMPQVQPATLAVTVLAFTYHWSNFIDPLLYLNRPSTFTLPLGIRLLQQLNRTDFPLLLAGAVLVTIPAALVFLIGQRAFLDDPLRRLGGRTGDGT